jgi:FkbM family methyltransferase
MYTKWFAAGCNAGLGVGNFFEQIINIIYTNRLQEGDVAVDGGVNRGLHTFPMSEAVGESGLVLGFEALTIYVDLVEEELNHREIGNVRVINKAIGNKNGMTSFTHVAAASGYSGIIERNGIPDFAKESISVIEVPIVKMDDEVKLLGLQKSIRFIKLDLEGGEYDALSGATYIMKNHDPFIVFENGRNDSGNLYGYKKEDWFLLFNSNDYLLYDLFGRAFAPEDWTTGGMPWYFIAIKRDLDVIFVEQKLPQLIEDLYQTITSNLT